MARLNSDDPAIRLQRADRWPVVESLVGATIWKEGIGHMAIARREADGRLVFGVFLVDVFCLGVKNAFWKAGTPGDFKDLIQMMEESQRMRPVSPECLAKIVKGAVEYARSFGFPPHHDYRHVSMLLEGIDTAACTQDFTFGRDGKPFYIRGPNESLAQARAIVQRVVDAGGHYIVGLPDPGAEELEELELESDEFDESDE
jgi:hypothetical protein